MCLYLRGWGLYVRICVYVFQSAVLVVMILRPVLPTGLACQKKDTNFIIDPKPAGSFPASTKSTQTIFCALNLNSLAKL